MALHYLVDGYNIVKSLPDLADKPIDAGRLTLIRWLEIYRPQGNASNKVDVIFDGRPGRAGEIHSSVVKVIFSQDESADDLIKRTVRLASNPKTFVVVTNDRDIQLHVRALGAKVLTLAAFLGQFKSPAQPSSGKPVKKEEEKYIPKTKEFEITAEFEKLWLQSGRPERKRPSPK